MKTNSVSSYTTANSTRTAVLKLQSELIRAQKEATTGQVADLGRALGGRVTTSVSLRVEQARLQTISDTNAIAASRLDTTQNILTALGDTAQSFISALIVAQQSQANPTIPATEAKNNLQDLIGALATGFNGEYMFGGINSDMRPMADYFAEPAPASRQAVEDAFQAEFGFPPSDPAAVDIQPEAMKAFLDGPFAALFDDDGWSANWSSASSQSIRSRISTTELVDTSVSANEQTFRDLTRGYAMVATLGSGNLSTGAMKTVFDTAAKVLGTATLHLGDVQTTIGLTQKRVADASAQMSVNIDVLTKLQAELEGVDPFDAATRVNTLSTQLEVSYALTARLNQLSLLNYI